MRIPLVRFGSDERPIEPWEDWLAPVVVPVVLPILFAYVLVRQLVGTARLLGWLLASPALPRSRRIWNHGPRLDLAVDPECPACRTPLTLGPKIKRGHVLHEPGWEITMPSQAAACPGCAGRFVRDWLGEVWSPWRLSG